MKPKTKKYLSEVLNGIWVYNLFKCLSRDNSKCKNPKCKNKPDRRSFPYCSSCSLNNQDKIK